MLTLVAVSIAGALIFVHLFSAVSASLGGVDLLLKLELYTRGLTSVVIPPLGVVNARTHSVPVRISIVVREINLDYVRFFLDNAVQNRAELMELFKSDLIKDFRQLALKVILIGMLGGVVSGAVMRYDRRRIAVCALIGLMTSVSLMGAVFTTYNTSAFKNPEYSGNLKAAPWIISLAHNGLSKLNELNHYMSIMSDNISTVFSRMDALNLMDDEDVVKVLHVSDIHNNPAAYNFLERITKNFDVDLIIDTGDITDFGTPFEELITENLSKMPVEYLFIAGNHDSPGIIDSLRKMPGVTVLDGEIAEVKGIEVVGWADPSSKGNEINTAGDREILELNLSIRQWLARTSVSPDIIAVHNPKATNSLAGAVPIILNGHTHRSSIIEEKGTFIINAGSTGAAGIRGLQSESDIPYSAALLYLKKPAGTGNARLIAVDVIKVSNLKKGFQVERMFFIGEEQKFE
ncbi:Icc-related predicted phosphoesterase [Thermosediminibacter litoriperuensis]|uniref:Icc-related predicted phosphoesterase n=1 Tax=Thermosediminibacter litoriperuensis TaxID=291989 RepID=A0A5S5AQK0_9FIRM|nr:Icc-related predicted phosphoesterase [Thermosediminibacter litoriperuensis]